jgi:hypothetical protein
MNKALKYLFLSTLISSQLTFAMEEREDTSCGCFSWFTSCFRKNKSSEEKQRLISKQSVIELKTFKVTKTVTPYVPSKEKEMTSDKIESNPLLLDLAEVDPPSEILPTVEENQDNLENKEIIEVNSPVLIVKDDKLNVEEKLPLIEVKEVEVGNQLLATALIQLPTSQSIQPNMPYGSTLGTYKGQLWVFKGNQPVRKYY